MTLALSTMIDLLGLSYSVERLSCGSMIYDYDCGGKLIFGTLLLISGVFSKSRFQRFSSSATSEFITV